MVSGVLTQRGREGGMTEKSSHIMVDKNQRMRK